MPINLGDHAASLVHKWGEHKKPEDLICNKNGLMWYIKEKGGMKKGNFSGNGLNEHLMIAELNDQGAAGSPNTIGFYQNYEVFNPDLTEEYVDVAQFNFKQLGAMIAFNGAEEIKYSGPEKRVELVASRVQGAMTNLENMAAASIFGDGTGSGGREFGGLGLLVQRDPTTNDTVAGINQSSFAPWRNQFINGGNVAPSASNILSLYLNPLHLDCKKKGDAPDICVMDSQFYLAYEDSEQGKVRHTNTKMAEAGFDNYQYKGMTMIYDENIADNEFKMLNSKHLKFRYVKDRFFSAEKARQVVLGDYKVLPVWVAGNLTCKDRSKQGVGFYTP